MTTKNKIGIGLLLTPFIVILIALGFEYGFDKIAYSSLAVAVFYSCIFWGISLIAGGKK